MGDSASEYWARPGGGTGDQDGLSWTTAAPIEPQLTPNIWDILNDLTVVGPVRVNLCADDPVLITESCIVAKDGTNAKRIYMRGRNAADTADALVTLDAQGGNFPIIDLQSADYRTFRLMHATNTNKTTGEWAWRISSGADSCAFIGCVGSRADAGFYGMSGAIHNVFVDCHGFENTQYGLITLDARSHVSGCACHNNGKRGFYSYGDFVDCLSYDNEQDGYVGSSARRCVAYRNGHCGFASAIPSQLGAFVDCISAENAQYGVEVLSTTAGLLRRVATLNNTSGRSGPSGLVIDEGDPGLTVDPFLEGAPKKELSAGGNGATATDNGDQSNIEDLSGSAWGGDVEIGDRIRFFYGGTGKRHGQEAVVTAIGVGGDSNLITVSPQVTAGVQKQCWLGGGCFALNEEVGGGAICRNTTGIVTADGWSRSYHDMGAVQHLSQCDVENGKAIFKPPAAWRLNNSIQARQNWLRVVHGQALRRAAVRRVRGRR